jgi:hypothetical protein
MSKFSFTLAISLLCFSISSFAYGVGDYRSTGTSASWASISCWERYNGTIWQPATSIPSNTNANYVYIEHTVNIDNSITIDQVKVTAAGHLYINATLFLADGIGDEMIINQGNVTQNAAVYKTSGSSPTIRLTNGGAYNWLYNNLGEGITMNIESSGVLNLANGGEKFNSAIINNDGIIDWSSNNISNGTVAGIINNYGFFYITATSASNEVYIKGQIINNYPVSNVGINLPLAAPASKVFFQNNGSVLGAFNNDGTITVAKGVLNNVVDGTFNGTIDVGSTGELCFQSATFTFANSTFSGVGNIVKNSDWIIGADLIIPNNFIYKSGSLSTSSFGAYTLTLQNSASIESCNIKEGITLKVPFTGTINFNTNATRELHGTIINEGIMNWNQNGMNNNSTLPTGTIQNNATCNFTSSASTTVAFYGINFINNYNATVNKNNTANVVFGDLINAATFDNLPNAKLNINSGNFTINQTGTHTGNIVIAAAASLRLGVDINYVPNRFTNDGNVFGSTLVLAGTVSQTLQGTGSYEKLKINNSNGIQLSNDISVTNLLDLTLGNINLAARTITLGNATIANASGNSFINTNGLGGVKIVGAATNTKLLPVGNTSGYTPLSLYFASGSVTDNFTVRCIDNLYQNYSSTNNPLGAPKIASCIKKTWFVSEDVAGGSTVNMTTYWKSINEAAGFDNTNNLKIWHYNGTSWDNEGTGGANLVGDLYNFTRTGITSFSPFGVANTGILPLTLISFTGKINTGIAQLAWKTTEEINVKSYEVERSPTGNDFKNIGSIKATGNFLQTAQYNFDDNNPFYGENFYRLKMIDNDGKFKYSPIIIVVNDNLNITVYPNPVVETIFIKVANKNQTTKLYDAKGSLLYANTIVPYQIDLSQLSKGVYLLQIGNKTTQVVKK